MSAYRSIDRSVESLGAPVRTHLRKPIIGPAPLVFTTIAAALSWLGAMSHPKLEGAAWLMTALAIASALLLGYEVYRTRVASAIVVHEKGIVLTGISPRILPWDEVTAVRFERKTRSKSQPVAFLPLPGVAIVTYERDTEHYWLCRIDVGGRVVAEVTDQYLESGGLVETLRTEIARRDVPRALDALQSGLDVSFGAVTLTPERIAIGDQSLPWNEIAAVQTDGAHLAIYDRTGEPRLRVRMERVLNPHVVMAVTEAFQAKLFAPVVS